MDDFDFNIRQRVQDVLNEILNSELQCNLVYALYSGDESALEVYKSYKKYKCTLDDVSLKVFQKKLIEWRNKEYRKFLYRYCKEA